MSHRFGYNADRVKNTQTYIIHKIRPIFLEFSKDTELEKCLHGKSQNANDIFNGTIWERIPKNTFVTLPNLKFELGVYDAVEHFNISMKASVLIYDKFNSAASVYMLKGCKKSNLKSVNLVNLQAYLKSKIR